MKFYLVATLLFTFMGSFSFADSSCWPEEKLVGRTATAYISGIHYKIKNEVPKKENEPEWPRKCDIKVYEKPVEKGGQVISCAKLQCIKGECGDGGDYTSLPVEQTQDPFVQALLKDNRKVWIKISPPFEVDSILPVGKMGNLFPNTAKVLNSPNGKPVKINSKSDVAYTFKKIQKVGQEEWVHVDINPILSSEPPVEIGKSIGQGYFLHRNSEKKIAAVLSDIWCD